MEDQSIEHAEKMFNAATCGDLKTIRSILRGDCYYFNEVFDDSGRNVLHKAARHGQADVVSLLVASGADVNVLSTRKRRSALYDACSKGYLLIATLLVDAGADIDCQEFRGRTPLYAAAFHNHADVVAKLLSKGAEYAFWDNHRRQALTAASVGGHVEALRELLKHPCAAARVNSVDISGRSALHYACMEGHANAAKLLLESGASLELEARAPLPGYNTALLALHSACYKGHVDVVRLLLDQDSIQLDLQDRNLCTALHMACRSGNTEIASLLLSKGADAGIRNRRGRPPMLEAAIAGISELVGELLERVAAPSPLPTEVPHSPPPALEAAAGASAWDINVCDEEGRSALHMACYNGHEAVVGLLLRRGRPCDPSLQDNDGQTALHMASLGGRAALIPLLVSHGCNADLTDRNGMTAAQVAKVADVRTLIEKEARWHKRKYGMWVASRFALPVPGARLNVLYRLPADVSRFIISTFL